MINVALWLEGLDNEIPVEDLLTLALQADASFHQWQARFLATCFWREQFGDEVDGMAIMDDLDGFAAVDDRFEGIHRADGSLVWRPGSERGWCGS